MLSSFMTETAFMRGVKVIFILILFYLLLKCNFILRRKNWVFSIITTEIILIC